MLFVASTSCFFFIFTRVHITLLHSLFFLMIRRPPRSTLDRSSAASDVYKRQLFTFWNEKFEGDDEICVSILAVEGPRLRIRIADAVSYTHLRAHETVLDLVCRLLLEKTKRQNTNYACRLYTTKLTTISRRQHLRYRQRYT